MLDTRFNLKSGCKHEMLDQTNQEANTCKLKLGTQKNRLE